MQWRFGYDLRGGWGRLLLGDVGTVALEHNVVALSELGYRQEIVSERGGSDGMVDWDVGGGCVGGVGDG